MLGKGRLWEKRRLSVRGLIDSPEASAEDRRVVGRRYRVYQLQTGFTFLALLGGGTLLLRRWWPRPSRYLLAETATIFGLSALYQSLRLVYIALLWQNSREAVRTFTLQQENTLRDVMQKQPRTVPSEPSLAQIAPNLTEEFTKSDFSKKN